MKCVKLSSGSVERVTDLDALMLVRDCNASYISKTEYKQQIAIIKEPTTK